MRETKEEKAKRMRKMAEDAAQKEYFNGVLLAAEGEEVLYAGAHGWADYESRRPLNLDSVFELASLSKPFTAAGIMLLQQEGLLGYDDPVARWLDDLPYGGITVRHLLQHTSGLPDYMMLFHEHWDRSRIARNEDVLAMLKLHQPPALFAPNDRWMYSNTGYVLLAVLIERVSGQSFPDFMKQRLFEPLGMRRTCVFNRRVAGTRLDNDAVGWSFDWESGTYKLPEEVEEQDFVVYLDGIQGDGTVNSTAMDLLRWDGAIRAGELIRKESWAEAFRPGRLNNGEPFDYGFGWIMGEDETKGWWVSHSGGWPGCHTMMTRYLDEEKTLIFLSNTDKDIETQQAVAEAAERILFGLPYDSPEPKARPVAIELAPDVIARYAGEYEFTDGQQIEVAMEGGRLFLLLPGQPAYELFALSETLFFTLVPGVQVAFETEGEPRAKRLILHQLGEHRALRVETKE